MNRITGTCLVGCWLVLTVGCNGPAPQAQQPSTVTITFINATADSGVAITFFNSADASVLPDALTDPATSDQLAFSLDANDSFQFTRSCSDFRAAVVDQASLIVTTGTGATASTGVLVDGMDFVCGDFITFSLSSQGPEDLQIDVSIEDTDPLAADATSGKGKGRVGSAWRGPSATPSRAPQRLHPQAVQIKKERPAIQGPTTSMPVEAPIRKQK